MYTKEAETADMYIEKITHKIGKKHRVRVATSDNLEQIIILGNGATRLSANELLQEVKLAEKNYYGYYKIQTKKRKFSKLPFLIFRILVII